MNFLSVRYQRLNSLANIYFGSGILCLLGDDSKSPGY